MDFKDPKIQKMMLGVLGFIALVYIWNIKMYQPTNNRLESQRGSYEQVMTNLKTIELKAKSLAGLRQEYERLLDRYQSIEQLLPEEDQVPDFLMQLNSASMLSQAQVTSVMPQVAGGEAFYNTSDYELKFVGTYHELGRFLAAVANFPFITNVSRLSLKGLPPDIALQKSKGERKTQGDYDSKTLEATFVLSTYFVKPEEKLKGVQFEGEEVGNVDEN